MQYHTMRGVVERGNVQIKYWSEYINDGKTMYFKVNQKPLKAIKGLRRNNQGGYYTKRVVNPAQTIEEIFKEYKV